MKKRASAGAAARELSRARARVAVARRALADIGEGGGAALDGEWRRAQRVLQAHAAQLRQIPGVIGHGLGYRTRDGIETREICIVVVVRRKWTTATLVKRGTKRIPRTLMLNGARVGVDVIELGRLKQQGVIASTGPINPINDGTIGVAGWDRDTKARVLITAMHVMNLTSYIPSPTTPPVFVSVPSRTDTAGAPVIGYLGLGTTTGFDAAKIIVKQWAQVRPYLPPAVAGWRKVSNDVNTVVHMFGKVSGQRSGVIKYIYMDLPEYKLVETIIVEGLASQYGDSGAALTDNAGFVLGFLFGIAPDRVGHDRRVFCPAYLVMKYLRCTLTPPQQ